MVVIEELNPIIRCGFTQTHLSAEIRTPYQYPLPNRITPHPR
ncbi:hypothetical protein [Proteus phage RP7]|nr:hypothetical protein [Proteus phage RP7]